MRTRRARLALDEDGDLVRLDEVVDLLLELRIDRGRFARRRPAHRRRVQRAERCALLNHSTEEKC